MSILHSENRDKKILSEIKSVIEDLGTDHLPTFGGKYEGGIHLQQVTDEIAPCIYDLTKQNINRRLNFLEIGSAAGGNTYLFNHFFAFDNITIIDDNKHKKHALRKDILKNINYNEFIGDSHDLKSVVFLEELQLNYDIIFIDGDHSYGGVLRDFELFREFLNYAGFIIFHDTCFCKGVKRLSDELKEISKLFNHNHIDVQPIKLFGDYVSEGDKKLGITVFQIYSIPKRGKKK